MGTRNLYKLDVDMTDEEKVLPETEKPDVDEAAHDEAAETTNVETPSKGQNDYEALLQREREARERAERALAERRFKHSEKERKATETEEQVEHQTEKPLTASDLQAILANERNALRRELQAQRYDEVVDRLATDESEKRLVKELLQSRSFPAHLTVEEQVEEAYAIANRKRLIAQRDEALRAVRSRETANTNPAGTHHDAPTSPEPKMRDSDILAIKAAGFAWNAAARRYEKKLPNKQTLVRDPKTKATFLVG